MREIIIYLDSTDEERLYHLRKEWGLNKIPIDCYANELLSALLRVFVSTAPDPQEIDTQIFADNNDE